MSKHASAKLVITWQVCGVAVFLVGWVAGCADDGPREERSAAIRSSGGSPEAAAKPDIAEEFAPERPDAIPKRQRDRGPSSVRTSGDAGGTAGGPAHVDNRPRTLADLLDATVDSSPRFLPHLSRLEIDEGKVQAAGIRKIESKRLVLYTDMPPDPSIEALPKVFDQAFPQWCKYFGVAPAKHADWRMTGFLMRDKPPFVHAGLLPESLPPFPHGYARNYEFWLYDQPSDYYRRHLLLHEGTHGFMNTLLGACGPPWYMEGIAELLSTHRWHDGTLTLNYMPTDRDETPHWGRIRIIKDAFEAQQALTLDKVIDYPPSAHLDTKAYAWSWAAAVLMDRHPQYRARFRDLHRHVLQSDFNDRFFRIIGDGWPLLCEDWQVFISGIEYGYDIVRAAIERTPGKPLPTVGTTVTVSAGRGWQSSGLHLEAGKRYRLTAAGRYQVRQEPEVWWCEPDGVSICYYQGRPLGQLLAAVRPEDLPADALSPLLRPVAVGRNTTLSPPQSGTLMLKINESAAELSDNAGELSVQVEPAVE